MSDAYVIELQGTAVGIIVRNKRRNFPARGFSGHIPTALSRRMAEPIAAGFSLFNLGKAEIGGFALEFRQTFVGGDIGLGEAGELQCPA